jgi:hypothetical protein
MFMDLWIYILTSQ